MQRLIYCLLLSLSAGILQAQVALPVQIEPPTADTLHAAPAEAAPAATAVDSLAPRRATIGETLKRKGSLLARFIRSFDDVDTTYIEPNHYNYTAMLQNTNFFQFYRFSAENEEGRKQSISFSPTPSFKLGPYFGWRWLFLGYTFDVGHIKKAAKKSSFNLSLYSSMLGLDFVYLKNSGDFKIQRTMGFDDIETYGYKGWEFNGLDAYTFSCNVYYVFNHRKFSYPAGYAQSTVQKRSAGSWILGFRYDHNRILFDYTALPEDLVGADGSSGLMEELKISKINYYNYSLTFGYAFNWAFAPGWMANVSATPALGWKRNEGERLQGDGLWLNMKDFNFDVIARAAIVWNNNRWYAGASLISHLFDYKSSHVKFTNSVNYVNIYFGVNFLTRKQYRKKNKAQ